MIARALQLVMLAATMTFVLAGTDHVQSINTTVGNEELPASINFKQRTLKLYTNQLESIPLPEDIEQAMISDNVCHFMHKAPYLKKESEKSVTSGVNTNRDV